MVRGINSQVATALGSGHACSSRLSSPTVHFARFQRIQVHRCVLAWYPEWFGLRPSGLPRGRRASWSQVTPVLGALWLALPGQAIGWPCNSGKSSDRSPPTDLGPHSSSITRRSCDTHCPICPATRRSAPPQVVQGVLRAPLRPHDAGHRSGLGSLSPLPAPSLSAVTDICAKLVTVTFWDPTQA